MPAGNPVEVWRRSEHAAVGPKPEHSRDGIAAAAVQIADQEGMAAVSIRRIAAVIGSGAASLYRYVKSRDELVELMIDRVSGEYSLDASEGPPLTRLLNLAREGRGLMHRHPWLAPLLLTQPSMGPHSLAYLEHALSALKNVDMPGPVKLQTIAMMTAITSAFVQNEMAAAPMEETSDGGHAPRLQRLVEAVQTGRYSLLAVAISEAPPQFDAEATFAGVITNYLSGAGVPSDAEWEATAHDQPGL